VRSAASALAAAIASLVRDYDMVGTLSQLCADCAEVVGASAAGIMLADEAGPLEMMAASSHTAADIDLYELQAGQGPCIEAFQTGQPVTGASPREIVARWPSFGPRAVAAGVLGAMASPLRWHDEVIGAMNVFFPAPVTPDDERQRVVAAFGDVATIAIIHAGLPPVADLALVARRALAARTVIEQAKGVIAIQTGMDMAASFDHLRALAQAENILLETLARDVVSRATRPRA
jgi:hypothetical protein